MNLKLQGKHVIVTGASGGIGQTLAQNLAAEGCRVTVHYFRNRESADGVVDAIGKENAFAIQADLSREDQVEKLFSESIEQFGPVDGFVANAGDWPSESVTVDSLDLARWKKTLDANLTSTFLCMKHFLGQSKVHQVSQPSAVMIGSTAGMIGEAGHSDYAAAKAALVHGLLPSLKNEFCRAIPLARINVVCPGWTMTPMTEKFATDQAGMARALQTIALRKFGRPDDMAAAVSFLLSPVAGHITGQVLTVSGGMEGRVLYTQNEVEI